MAPEADIYCCENQVNEEPKAEDHVQGGEDLCSGCSCSVLTMLMEATSLLRGPGDPEAGTWHCFGEQEAQGQAHGTALGPEDPGAGAWHCFGDPESQLCSVLM